GCNIRLKKQWDRNTVWFDKSVVETVEASARLEGYSYKQMVSGAGHDSQFIATFIPTSMIFVPSINGKSHSEDELTYWDDCENGGNVMLRAVLSLIDH